MKFEAFTDKILTAVKEQLGEKFQLSIRKVRKNNNISLTGLVIISRASNVAPAIYLEPFYHAVADGRITFEQAALDIVGIYNKNSISKPFDISDFTEYKKIRSRIRKKLINTEKNMNILAKVPHREYMDLCMVYTVVLDCGNGEQGNVTVNYEHMKLWGVTEQELFEQAESNRNAADDLEITRMSEIVRQTVGDETAYEISEIVPMYVVTNKKRLCGAVAMLDQKIMKKAAEIVGGDFIILPSSIHEMLVFPVPDRAEDVIHMACMVKEINAAELMEDEVLSDHVYRYNYHTGEIEVAA